MRALVDSKNGGIKMAGLTKGITMRITGQIPLRFLHTVGANFTLQIQRKPIAPPMGLGSFKKISDKPDKPISLRMRVG